MNSFFQLLFEVMWAYAKKMIISHNFVYLKENLFKKADLFKYMYIVKLGKVVIRVVLVFQFKFCKGVSDGCYFQYFVFIVIQYIF